MPGCYNPHPTHAYPRHLCTSHPGKAKNDEAGEEGKPGEELKLKTGEEIRLKLGEERMYDLGRGEDRPKLQTPRVSTR